MSASLQYSNYDGNADFAIPYEILTAPEDVRNSYLESCRDDMNTYAYLTDCGIGHDTAGYVTPQALRNILIISATPYQWKHMIAQRSCRRNTDETRYVMLLIWKELCKLSPMFENCGPFCMNGPCKEGRMTCARPIDRTWKPEDILKNDYEGVTQW